MIIDDHGLLFFNPYGTVRITAGIVNSHSCEYGSNRFEDDYCTEALFESREAYSTAYSWSLAFRYRFAYVMVHISVHTALFGHFWSKLLIKKISLSPSMAAHSQNHYFESGGVSSNA